MPKLSWTLDVYIVNGVRVTVGQTLEVEAAAQVEVAIPKGGTAKTVDVPGGERASFLLVRTGNDTYPKVPTALTFARPGAAGDPFNLDGPQVFTGSNSVKLLGGAPTKLEFKNNTPDDVVVELIVGGDATP